VFLPEKFSELEANSLSTSEYVPSSDDESDEECYYGINDEPSGDNIRTKLQIF
jgi:hypothetical protein